MTQFRKRTHVARTQLEQAGRLLPGIWAACDAVRAAEAQPPGIYLTDPAGGEAYARAAVEAGGMGAARSLMALTPLQLTQAAMPFTTLAAWRMTQGIYRVDPALYAALIDTDLRGDLPAQVLERLPEWCLYIETPGLHAVRHDGHRVPLVGVWARLNRPDGAPVELVLGQLIEGHPRIEHQAIPLVGTLQQSLAGVFAEWDADQGALPGVNAWCAAVISLLLYICEGDDIQGRGQPGNPEPTRTRRDGWRMFPAQGVRMWDVGVRMGAALRAAYQAAETDQGGTHAGPRGHVRRAHWHGYWSGPLKDKDGQDIPRVRRKFDLRWQPPIAVNLPDIDTLPATIRKVTAPPATP